MDTSLVSLCIERATESAATVEKWRRQRRTLERMPSHLAEALLQQLLRRRLLFPSLLEVFKYSVEEIDLGGESCVDAEWMAYLGAFRYLRSIGLADCNRINNSALWSVTGMLYLKEVDLSRCSRVTNAGMRHLSTVPVLEKLCISGTGVTADGIAVLAKLTNLVILDLGGLPVTDSVLRSLQALTKLQHLDIWGSEVSNDGAVLLKMFPSLSFLNLAWTGVTNLPNLSSLAYLNMSNCTIHSLFEGVDHKVCLEKVILAGATISDVSKALRYIETSRLQLLDLSNTSLQSFSFLHSMNALAELNLSDSALTDNSVDHIAFIGTNIRYLNLTNTKVSSLGVGTLVGHVPNLETMLLSGTCIDDTVVSYISMMPSLKVINLSRTNVKGANISFLVFILFVSLSLKYLSAVPGLIHQEDDPPHDVPSFSALQNLSHLERLDLEEVKIKDAALFPLTKLDKLSHLSLRSVSFTDASLFHISSAPKLMHLSVRDAVLTDAGLDSFIPPPLMEVLDLRGCWLLTEDVLLRFCHKHPRIEVRHELVEAFNKSNFHYPSPLRATSRTPQSKHKQGKLSVSPHMSGDIILDQRLKYSREDLLQFSSAAVSNSTCEGEDQALVPASWSSQGGERLTCFRIG